jgi:hypothetical protein
VFATISLACDDASADCPDVERLMNLLAFLAADHITVDMIPPSVIDLIERTAAIEALAARSLITLKEGQIIIHRLTQEVIRQRVHESNSFAIVRPALHETLKYAFANKKPNLFDAMWDHLLWCLHYDPAPDASIELSYDRNHRDLEFNLDCKKHRDCINIQAQVLAHHGQMHYGVYRYRLADGWKRE